MLARLVVGVLGLDREARRRARRREGEPRARHDARARADDGGLEAVVAVDQSTVASTRAALGVPAPKSAAGTGVREARVS